MSRFAARSSMPPEYRYNDYGFRVVLTVDPLLGSHRVAALDPDDQQPAE